MILLKQLQIEINDSRFDRVVFSLCLSVHIGGGLWGIFALPIFRRTIEANASGQSTDDMFNSIVYRFPDGESWRVNFTIFIYEYSLSPKTF